MENFIIDTNFFISLNQISETLWLKKLHGFIDANQQVKFYITRQILNEMPFLRGSKRNQFLEAIIVEKVAQDDIDSIKSKLKKDNPAQDPDLSLLSLALTKVNNVNENTWLVSDDYKLVQNAQEIDQKIKILTPGSFLLKLYTLTDETHLKRFFKSMEKKITDYSIKYILSRKDIYPAAKKLSWLIDRTASLVGTVDDLSNDNKASMDLINRKTSHITSSDLSEAELTHLKICDIYLTESATLNEEQLKSIEKYRDYLELLKLHVKKLEIIKKEILEENYKIAKEEVHPLDHDIMNAIIMAKFEYKDEFAFLHVLSSLQIYKVEFYKAYISLLQENVLEAFSYLNEMAYWAMQSHQDAALLNTVYMKAMLFFFNFNDIPDFYFKAIENFEYARYLAEKMGDKELEIKCLLSKAISSYQVKRIDDAKDFINIVQNLAMEYPEAAVDAFTEMADYFLIFGKPEYSVFLYDEALEASVVAKMEHKHRSLVEKMKKSYIIAGVRMNEIESAGVHLDTIIDDSFQIKDKADIERYNEEIMNLAEFNSLSYQPFPYIYKKWTNYLKIDSALKNDFELVSIDTMGELRSRIVVFSSQIGLIGFIIPKKVELAGPPEAYSIRLANDAEIKTKQVKGDLFEEKLIRALVYIRNYEQVILKRQVPSFLKLV